MDQSLSFQPLLFGGDINVYSVARAFHEAYGVRSVAFGKYPSFPCHGSAIIDYRVCPDNESDEAFLRNARAVAGEFADKTVLLLGCGDSYVQLAARHRDHLPENVIAPYISEDLLNSLINKERFYQLCDQHGVDHPATFIYDKSMGHDFSLPWGPPYIAKPADSVAYWACGDHSLAKVYICQSWEELLESLDHVYAAGYQDHMVLQEFIPGDDSYMRVLTSYSDRNGKVTTMCLGHVLLEEHSPHGIGNHAVILTDCDEELESKFRDLLESLHFTGFSNFDIKYDRRDGKYKAFEINCRQGRSNYYVTGSGHNIAKMVVEDRVEHQGPALPDDPRPLPVADGAPESRLQVHPQGLPRGDAGADPGGEGLPLSGLLRRRQPETPPAHFEEPYRQHQAFRPVQQGAGGITWRFL